MAHVKGIGFCITIKHAKFMADMFSSRGIRSEAIVSGIDDDRCRELLNNFNSGHLTFLFTVDKLSEGIDIPDINTVLFLRPTESLTVFLQQLGRGLRHAPSKDCLTVIDFVGQAHRKYRIDTKLKALLPRHRYSIDKEVDLDFPHLSSGCSIQLDPVSREHVLENIRENYTRLAVQVPDRIQTFSSETGKELTFGNFIYHNDYEPETLLARDTWSGWKAKAQLSPIPVDPDLAHLRKTLVRAAFVNGVNEIQLLRQTIKRIYEGAITEALSLAGSSLISIYYRLWGAPGNRFHISSFEDAFRRLSKNPTILADLDEILSWAEEKTQLAGITPELPFDSSLELHGKYSSTDIIARLGQASLETAGQRGVGVLHFADKKAYALLITYQKTEREFSPSTMYADYPISRELLHWESQSNTAELSETGQNLINHIDRGYTILIFARNQKKRNGVTLPFTYLGPAERVNHGSERPIKIVWRLQFPMLVEMFEDNRKGG